MFSKCFLAMWKWRNIGHLARQEVSDLKNYYLVVQKYNRQITVFAGMLHKWRIKWSNADFAVVKCEVQRSGATNTDNTWRWQRCGDYGTPGTEGIDVTRRGTMRSYGALNCSMYFLCNSCQEESINACCYKISRGLYKTINVSLHVISKCLCDIIKISKYNCLGILSRLYGTNLSNWCAQILFASNFTILVYLL